MAFDGKSRLRFVLLCTLAIALLFPTLNRGGLSGYDDALYAHEGREMLRGGDWWTVHFNGRPNFEYPPLFLWMEAASMRLLGSNDYAAKLPSALAGLGTAVVLYFLAAEITGDLWLASVAMFVLITSQLFLKYATHAMTDVPFTFLVTVAFYFYVKGFRKPWYWALAGAAVGLAILTRSIIGIFPLVVMAAHLALNNRYRRLPSPQFALACLLALGLPAIWFGFPPRPEHVAFVLGKVGGAPWKPSLHIFDYGLVLLKFYWPWLPFLVAGIVIEVRARERSLPLLWFVLLVVPLSFAGTKYARYLLPAFPALALLSAVAVNRILPERSRAWAFATGCALMFAVAGYIVLFPARERGADMRALAPLAARNTEPSERILLYTGGDTGYDYQNQLLWYSSRYTTLVTDLGELKNQQKATLIIDKPSFATLSAQVAPGKLNLLGESEKFVCAREK